MKATVIGAGLAGSEAAWQLAKRGVDVTLHEMKPVKKSPAHKSDLFAELVCSNSLRSDRLQNAVGLLKEEMRLLDSLVMRAADAARVPAGGALAVDRERFSGPRHRGHRPLDQRRLSGEDRRPARHEHPAFLRCRRAHRDGGKPGYGQGVPRLSLWPGG